MAEDWPKIKARRTTQVSPWMAIIEREVEFAPGAEQELYHAVGQQDYIAIVATLPDGRIPIVRQYRPTLESFTWNYPPGLSTRARTRLPVADVNSWRKPVLLLPAGADCAPR
jgi:hypothetical protein